MLQRRLLGFVRLAPVPVAVTILLGVLAMASAVGQGVAFATILTRVLAGQADDALRGPVVAIVVLMVVRGGLAVAKDLASQWTAAVVKAAVRRRLMDRLLALGPGFTARRRSGDLQAVVADGVEALQAYVGFYLPQAAVAVVVQLTLVGVMIWLDPVVGVVVLLGTLLVPLSRPLFRRLLGERGRAHWEAYTDFSARVMDALSGMTTLKTLNASGRYGRRLQEDAARLYRATVGNLAASLGVYSVVTFGFGLGTAMAIAAGAWRVAAGELDAATLFIILLLSAECFRPLLDLQNYWHEGFYGLAASSGIFGLLDTPVELTDPADGVVPAPSAGPPEVRLEGVSYTYPGSGRPAVQGVDLVVAGGKTLALVGRSGSGKSTLVALLLRFMDPDEGRVLIDGADLRDLPLPVARALTAVVSQDVYLFNDSVAVNLRLAAPHADDTALQAAARAANVHDVITALPQGYDTSIGERGNRLSGGERQRLAIARALLADAPVLILDEATSSIDGENEAAIRQAIDRARAGRTTLVIAHRLSTVAHADTIVVLEDGEVVETGTPAALHDGDGRFADLVAAQTSATRPADAAGPGGTR